MKVRIIRLCTRFTENYPADEADIVRCGEGEQGITFFKDGVPAGGELLFTLGKKDDERADRQAKIDNLLAGRR